MHGMTRL
ncbi:UNVERIFIED_CONTAM: hypothetical protein GTU68_026048 [Idotea baltica]|nr:hypothetical protein [Idotea baltica]